MWANSGAKVSGNTSFQVRNFDSTGETSANEPGGKSVGVKRTPTDVTRKFGEGCRLMCPLRHLTTVPNYETIFSLGPHPDAGMVWKLGVSSCRYGVEEFCLFKCHPHHIRTLQDDEERPKLTLM
ncbi:hypothetical protein AVEN_244696-1 [Araneus ventricosus]|uniref:Uncharacterized protein n=1 Tax=Araneus ventricosus TaxID=182803 RepID=A0A4Y2PT32_ARAVE|nr:hypothetical protein AVEN_244696-1 [Araneus ventricosus]